MAIKYTFKHQAYMWRLSILNLNNQTLQGKRNKQKNILYRKRLYLVFCQVMSLYVQNVANRFV